MTPETAVRCECTEHACVPVPKQHVRYHVRVGAAGPEDQGVVMLCAFCFTQGHMWPKELRYQREMAKQRKGVKA